MRRNTSLPRRFNAGYDKIGVVKYSTTTSSVSAWTSNLSGLQTTIGNFAAPTRAVQTSPEGSQPARLVLDGVGKRANAVRVLVLLEDGIANYVCGSDLHLQYGRLSTAYRAFGEQRFNCDSTEPRVPASHPSRPMASTMISPIGLGDGVDANFLRRIADGGDYGVLPCQDNDRAVATDLAPTPSSARRSVRGHRRADPHTRACRASATSPSPGSG